MANGSEKYTEKPSFLGNTALSVHIEINGAALDTCVVTFTVPNGSPLLKEHKSAGAALAAYRDLIVKDFDALVALANS